MGLTASTSSQHKGAISKPACLPLVQDARRGHSVASGTPAPASVCNWVWRLAAGTRLWENKPLAAPEVHCGFHFLPWKPYFTDAA